VLVYTPVPITPGSMILVRPVGILRIIDGGEVYDKIVAVPASSIDLTYDSISDISYMPAMELERLGGGFNVYKRLPQSSDVIELRGFGASSEAQAMVR
jgi:inorganic pyrophosphatase